MDPAAAPNRIAGRPPGGALARARRLWPLPIALAGVAAWLSAGSDPERLFAEAQAEARAGRYARAAALAGRLARLRPATPADHLLRAQVDGGLERTDAAVAELASIADDDPLGEVARLSEGQLEARRGRLRAAEQAFRRTLARRPSNAQARRELVYIYSIRRRLDRLDEQLAALAGLGALDRAHLIHWGRVRHVPWSAAADLSALKRYVAADPDDRDSRLSLADALIRLGQPDEAEATLGPLAPADFDALEVRARLAEIRGDTATLELLLARGPVDHPGLARIRGRLALFRGDAAAAEVEFRIARDRDPHDRATLSGLATALAMLGKADEAAPLRDEVRRFDRLGALIAEVGATSDRDDPSVAREIGLACAGMGRAAEARAWLRHAIGLDPLDIRAQDALHRLEQESPGVD